MALRTIREIGDDILQKKSKEVKMMTPRICDLIDDMWETMDEAQGVGLAAVQVGILKRLFIVCVDDEHKYVFINPTILEQSGEQTDYEGCLSVPGKTGKVSRPQHVVVEAFDEDMTPFRLEADDLLARAILHEYDHLDGIIYTSKVEGELYDSDNVPAESEEEFEEGSEE